MGGFLLPNLNFAQGSDYIPKEKKIIVMNPDGTAVNPEDEHLVPDSVRSQIREQYEDKGKKKESMSLKEVLAGVEDPEET